MTLEDISILFGDPVELRFEQAMVKQMNHKTDDELDVKEHDMHIESVLERPATSV